MKIRGKKEEEEKKRNIVRSRSDLIYSIEKRERERKLLKLRSINKRISLNTDIITRLDESPVFSYAERILAKSSAFFSRRGEDVKIYVARSKDARHLVLDSSSH